MERYGQFGAVPHFSDVREAAVSRRRMSLNGETQIECYRFGTKSTSGLR